MGERKKVYRVRYTWDNRIKAVEVSEEPIGIIDRSKRNAWVVVAVGAVLCVIWWLIW